MIPGSIFSGVKENIEVVLEKKEPIGLALWDSLVVLHPADIATFLGDLDRAHAKKLFLTFPKTLQASVFQDLSESLKVFVLSFLSDKDRAEILGATPLDELTDLFEDLSDDDLKRYLKLLHKKDRDTVISLLQFDPESAGGIMATDVVTLIEDFTVENSIHVLQRLQPDQDLHRRIFVTNQEQNLVGYVNLEDLVIHSPSTRISAFMRKNELVVQVTEDQESVAHQMVHYGLVTVPVVDQRGIFLGVITTDKLVDIIEQEASENVYKMSAMAPIKERYFETPFFKMAYERGSILGVLLVAQTLSSIIVEHYEAVLTGFLTYFITMLVSTGGNASSQTSAIVIQGMASGEITPNNMMRFVKRELLMAVFLGGVLGLFSFIRILITHGTGRLLSGIAVSSSLALLVLVSVVLGSSIPLLLKKLRLDPALSAGPGLATLMDILGLFIYCYVSYLILG
ncbi:magnesium transporter [Candidatus Babeliales bacterium]|nr:magnesium transporter [Candidatus Babeliales bacterium]